MLPASAEQHVENGHVPNLSISAIDFNPVSRLVRALQHVAQSLECFDPKFLVQHRRYVWA